MSDFLANFFKKVYTLPTPEEEERQNSFLRKLYLEANSPEGKKRTQEKRWKMREDETREREKKLLSLKKDQLIAVILKHENFLRDIEELVSLTLYGFRSVSGPLTLQGKE